MKRAIAFALVSFVACDGGTLDVGHNRVDPPMKATHVATGMRHACAILPDTTVACWGQNFAGEVGVSPDASWKDDAPYPYVSPPVRVPDLVGAVQISAAWQVTYALVQSGDVYHWGTIPQALLDLRGGAPLHVPAKLAGLDHVVEIRAGGGAACARKDDGTVWCWGENFYENVGIPATHTPTGDFVHPTRVEGISDAAEIAVSQTTSCARHADGDVSCWGLVGSADDSTITDPIPHRVPDVHHATELAIAGASVFALLENGTVTGWGQSSDVLRGRADVDGGPPVSPAPLSPLNDVRAISAQDQNACAITGGGAAWCWGANAWGELGLGTTSPEYAPPGPTRVPGLTASEIAVGTMSSCARRASGDFTCFGQSLFGSLGRGGNGNAEAATPGAPVVLPP